ncbi:MAG TPA: cytochrome c biogenesis protein CcdA [Chitinophagales bacterium]|nr:cytochrome c biogenesis protein CcdA [Chitinophagales bacterium]
MRKLVLVALYFALTGFYFAGAQIVHPVKWAWKAEAIGKGEYKLTFTATIQSGWPTYSQYIGNEGPVPTKISFDDKNKDIQLKGKTTENGSKVYEGHDPVFDMQIKYFQNDMTCTQVVKVLKDTKLKGTIEYMVCDDSRCLPPDDIDFEFDLKAGDTGVNPAPIKPKEQGSIKNNTGQKAFDSTVQAVIAKSMATDTAKQLAVTDGTKETARFGEAISNCNAGVQTTDKSLWAIIVLGFLGGLVALVTPCVFPMIPLTVSFFTKRNENSTKGKLEAFFYAFSIVLIYFLIAVPFLIFKISPDTLNDISTGAPLNIFFFVVFLVFAFSFFGYYEITLPSFIANKADSASNVGGLVGIFFMAVTLAIVSFSCTGPIIGSLLVGALTSANGKLNLVAGMTSFGFALALPFGLFAFFPSMMKSLPKSGGWLNSVKVVLGFVELIFAVKFLSNADLVAHWGILKRETFLGLWVLFGAGLFAYLVGWIKFPHDSGKVKLNVVRGTTAVAALLFTFYTAYGLPGNSLHLFSGFPPPKFYSLFGAKSAIEPIKNDYDAALALAKAEHKPLMIDFTGWACVNCRKMEENVWPDIDVRKRLLDDFVVVSLYVDDKEALPESEQYVSTFSEGKRIKTIGNKYSEMQAKYFGANTQPFYVLVTPDERLLTHPAGYTPDVKEYVKFLDCGLNTYKALGSK